jgi:Cu-Zn family superoxide dismutase
MTKGKILWIAMLGIVLPCFAQEQSITMNILTDDKAAKGIGKVIGTVTLQESKEGLLIKSNLTNLSPGDHGFHVHENPSCEGKEKAGKWIKSDAAGSHYDPDHKGHHLGPFANGHKGDLPYLTANEKGESQQVLLAPHLKLAELKDRSLIIHLHGDNNADTPQPLGGGGDRIACGVMR